MKEERTDWFWAITIIFIAAWMIGGLMAVFLITQGHVMSGEIFIITTSILIVALYYLFDWSLGRK